MQTFSGRIKSIDFTTGRIDIANKAKDYFFARHSGLATLALIATENDVLGSPIVTFELDGKIIIAFMNASGPKRQAQEPKDVPNEP